MFEHLVGLFLIGLGVRTPVLPGTVLGDTNEAFVEQRKELQKKELELKNTLRVKEQEFRANILKEGTKPGEAGRKFSEGVRNLKESSISAEDRRKKMQELLEQKKQQHSEILEDIKTRREEAKTAFKTQREAFQKRLETIKDERKKSTVQKLDGMLTQVNTKRTEAMTQHLNKMDEILTKLSTQAVDISAAQVAISSAKTAVATQAGKEYVIGVTTENNLGEDVSRAKNALEADLKAVQEIVAQARQAVGAAIKAGNL